MRLIRFAFDKKCLEAPFRNKGLLAPTWPPSEDRPYNAKRSESPTGLSGTNVSRLLTTRLDGEEKVGERIFALSRSSPGRQSGLLWPSLSLMLGTQRAGLAE